MERLFSLNTSAFGEKFIASHYTVFIEAKAELLLRTARIQEDIDYLCRVKEVELAEKECPDDQSPM